MDEIGFRSTSSRHTTAHKLANPRFFIPDKKIGFGFSCVGTPTHRLYWSGWWSRMYAIWFPENRSPAGLGTGGWGELCGWRRWRIREDFAGESAEIMQRLCAHSSRQGELENFRTEGVSQKKTPAAINAIGPGPMTTTGQAAPGLHSQVTNQIPSLTRFMSSLHPCPTPPAGPRVSLTFRNHFQGALGFPAAGTYPPLVPNPDPITEIFITEIYI